MSNFDVTISSIAKDAGDLISQSTTLNYLGARLNWIKDELCEVASIDRNVLNTWDSIADNTFRLASKLDILGNSLDQIASQYEETELDIVNQAEKSREDVNTNRDNVHLKPELIPIPRRAVPPPVPVPFWPVPIPRMLPGWIFPPRSKPVPGPTPSSDDISKQQFLEFTRIVRYISKMIKLALIFEKWQLHQLVNKAYKLSVVRDQSPFSFGLLRNNGTTASDTVAFQKNQKNYPTASSVSSLITGTKASSAAMDPAIITSPKSVPGSAPSSDDISKQQFLEFTRNVRYISKMIKLALIFEKRQLHQLVNKAYKLSVVRDQSPFSFVLLRNNGTTASDTVAFQKNQKNYPITSSVSSLITGTKASSAATDPVIGK